MKPRPCRLSRLGGCIYTGDLFSTAISGKDTKERCFSNWLSRLGKGLRGSEGGPRTAISIGDCAGLRAVDYDVARGSSIVGVSRIADLGVHTFPPTARRREGVDP